MSFDLATSINESTDDASGDQVAAASGEQQIFFPDVAFDFDDGSLNALGRGRVRQIAQLLASVPSLKVVVEGHTDAKGTDEYNQRLGEKRAQAVISELSELGIDPLVWLKWDVNGAVATF